MADLGLDKRRQQDKGPSPSSGSKKKVTVQIELGFDTSFLRDPAFRSKALFLIALALFFVFAAVMFQRSNLHLSDLFDTPRFAYHLSKLWSPAFLLFLVLYGAAMAVSGYYGYKLNWLPALFPLVLSLVLAGLLSMWMPAIWQVFVALGVSVGSVALFTSRYEKPTLSNAWSSSGFAVMLFTILALAFVFARVSAYRDVYFDSMLSGATQMATGAVAQGGAGALSASALAPSINAMISGVNMDDAFFRSILRPADLAVLEPGLQTTCSQVATVALTSSGVCQNLLNQNFNTVAAAGGGAFSGQVYNKTIPVFVALAPTLKQRMSDAVTSGLSNALNQAGAGQTQAAAPVLNPATLRQTMLTSLPPLKVAYDYMAYMVALSVASILYTVSILSRIIAALAAWGLGKLL